jgi:exodeoxyribonuclease V alpha subunit
MVTGGTPLAQSTIMLRRSRRFGGVIGRLALAVNADEVGRAEDILRAADGDEVAWLEHARLGDIPDLSGRGRLGAEGGYATYLNLAKAGPGAAGADPHTAWAKSMLGVFDAFRVLCVVRQCEWGVEGVNAAIEAGWCRRAWSYAAANGMPAAR